MKCDRTATSRLWPYHETNLTFDGREALRSHMLRFIQGIKGVRKIAVTEREIVQWFRCTRPDFVREVLWELVMRRFVKQEGRAYRITGEYTVAFFYPNGSLLDRTGYPTRDEAEAELRSSATVLEAGEYALLEQFSREIDRRDA
jgi:hypothetical protein